MRNEFTAIIEPPDGEDNWFVAYCLEIPEANGQGLTEAEARTSLAGGIDLVLEVHREQSLRGVSPGAIHEVIVVEAPGRESALRNELTAIIERGEQGWLVGSCPEIPEANGQGRTMDEVLTNLRDGIALELEMRREERLRDVSAEAVLQVLVVE